MNKCTDVKTLLHKTKLLEMKKILRTLKKELAQLEIKTNSTHNN